MAIREVGEFYHSLGEAAATGISLLAPVFFAMKRAAKAEKEREAAEREKAGALPSPPSLLVDDAQAKLIGQIQRERDEKAAEIIALNARLDRERERADLAHDERLAALDALQAQRMDAQEDRHERKSILRAYETRCRDAGVACDDLCERAKALENKT